MAVLKCKICGGDLEITEGSNICECLYCGRQQTVPTLDDERKTNLFNRANRLRLSNEFDMAANVFQNIVSDFPEEAEAYWGLCLCRFGIEYVEDPTTHERKPTCHRTEFESIFDYENFELACEYANSTTRNFYREEAKEIDRLQKEILALVKNEEPYDVFICYKETDERGDRTKDSVMAQDIYTALTKEGYKVFFARITLEGKLGEAYEPIIFSALNTSKVMLAVGTKYEYFSAVWVKNEWSRFLDMKRRNPEKVLIPCYADIDAYDMPKEFKNLQGQDMGKVGFIQDLVRGIGKIIPKAAPAQNGNLQNVDIQALISQAVSAAVGAQAPAAVSASGEWKCPDCGKINTGDMCPVCGKKRPVPIAPQAPAPAPAKPKSPEELYPDYVWEGTTIVGYTGSDTEIVIPDIATAIGEDAFRDCDALTSVIIPKSVLGVSEGAFIGCENLKYVEFPSTIENIDENIFDLYSEDTVFVIPEEYKNELPYLGIMEDFAVVKWSEDVEAEKAPTADSFVWKDGAEGRILSFLNAYSKKVIIPDGTEEIASKAFEKNERLESIVFPDSVKLIGDQAFIDCASLKSVKFGKGLKTIGSGAFNCCFKLENVELPDGVSSINDLAFHNCTALKTIRIPDTVGKIGRAALEECTSLEKAYLPIRFRNRLEEIGIAEELVEFTGDEKALAKYKEDKEFEENQRRQEEEALAAYESRRKREEERGLVEFGSYPQVGWKDDKKQPIQWIVLEKRGANMLLMTRDCIEAPRFYADMVPSGGKGGWDDSTARAFLNGEFFNKAFTPDEQRMIMNSHVPADANPDFPNVDPGSPTNDKVFILSLSELNRYFTAQEDKAAVASDYITHFNMIFIPDELRRCNWLLRTPGDRADSGVEVLNNGKIMSEGFMGNRNMPRPLRPVIWVQGLAATAKPVFTSPEQTAYEQAQLQKEIQQREERARNINALKAEYAQLSDELENLRGMFAGKRRKEILPRLDEIAAELRKYGVNPK